MQEPLLAYCRGNQPRGWRRAAQVTIAVLVALWLFSELTTLAAQATFHYVMEKPQQSIGPVETLLWKAVEATRFLTEHRW